MVIDIGSALGGGSEEEFKGVTNRSIDPALLRRIPEGIEKIHCDIKIETAMKDLQKAIWPDTFPPIEDIIDLFKDFSITKIQEFIVKAVTNFLAGGVSGAADSLGGLLGGKKYDKIEPVCIEALIGRGDDCQCNRGPGIEITTDNSQEEFVLELTREFPPMLLMPVLDEALITIILKLITLADEELSENDEVKLQIIWFYLKFKEYMGYQDGTPTPVPNIFSGSEKFDREAHLDHYHWYNMEVLNNYLSSEGVSVENLNFIDKFFEFSEIKQQITGLLNNVYEKPLYDRELLEALFEQVSGIFEGIVAEIPIEININLDPIIDNFFPAPTIGILFERFGIKPDSMTDGGQVSPGEKAGIIIEVAILQVIKLVLHEALFRPLLSKDRSEHIEIGATILGIIIGLIPIYWSDNIGVKKAMYIISTLLSIYMIIAKISETVIAGTNLGGDKEKIGGYICDIFLNFIFIVDKVIVIISNIFQLISLFTNKPMEPEEIEAIPADGKGYTGNYLGMLLRYILFDILSLEQAWRFFQWIYFIAAKNKPKQREALKAMKAPVPPGFVPPWKKGKKQSGFAFFAGSFFRNLLDFVLIEILVEWIFGFIKVLASGALSGDLSMLHPVQTGRRYRNNAANFFGIFIDPVISPTLKNKNTNQATVEFKITDIGTADRIDFLAISWQDPESSAAPQIQNYQKDYKENEVISHIITGLTPGKTYNYIIKCKCHHKIFGVVEPIGESSTAPATFTTPPILTTENASDITTTSAKLNGNLRELAPLEQLNVSFEWGDTPGTYSNTTNEQNMTALGAFETDITGLEPDKAYYYRVKAVVDGTNVFGEELTFNSQTPQPPVLTTNDASDIEIDGSILNGELTDLGTASEVQVYFEWGESSGNLPNKTTEQTLTEVGTFNTQISGLDPGTDYFFRAIAEGHTTVQGSEMTLTTLTNPPVTATSDASNVESESATINGDLSDLGTAKEVEVSFEWGENSGDYTNETTPVKLTNSGSFNNKLTDLTPEKTYYFRTKAVGDGTVYGDELNFSTPKIEVPPEVSIVEAIDIKKTTALMQGEVLDLGSASSVKVSIQSSKTPGEPYENESAVIEITETGSFEIKLTGLKKDTNYYCRAKIEGDGISFGDESNFKTEK